MGGCLYEARIIRKVFGGDDLAGRKNRKSEEQREESLLFHMHEEQHTAVKVGAGLELDPLREIRKLRRK